MPGSSNFQQWNPTATNQESDADYAADVQRSGGSTDPSPFLSVLANKLFYQLSTFVTAFGQMMAAKGYNVSDADVNALAATLAGVITSADQRQPFVGLPYSPAAQFDISKSESYQMTLEGDTTVSFVGYAPGRTVKIAFLQDGAGGHVVTWPVGAAPGQVLGAGSVDPTSGAMSLSEMWTAGDNSLRALTGQSVTP